MLRAGIVRLPNMGKSTVFNALTAIVRARGKLSVRYYRTECRRGFRARRTPGTTRASGEDREDRPGDVEFLDIAGLVRGASKVRFRGTSFSPTFGETIRCSGGSLLLKTRTSFTSRGKSIHCETSKRSSELAFADLATGERAARKRRRVSRVVTRLRAGAGRARQDTAGTGARPIGENSYAHRHERAVARNFFLLTTKPTIYAANVEEAPADIENNLMVDSFARRRCQRRLPNVWSSRPTQKRIWWPSPEERVII